MSLKEVYKLPQLETWLMQWQIRKINNEVIIIINKF